MRSIIIILIAILWLGAGYPLAEANLQSERRTGVQQKRVRNQVVKGMKLFKANKLDESADIFKNILKKDNNSLIAMEMLAIISFRKNDLQTAERYARMSLKQNARSAKAHLVLAGISRKKGNILAMRDHLRKAKKFASDKEREYVKEFLEQNNLDLKDLSKETTVINNAEDYRIQATGYKPLLAVFTFAHTDDNEKLGEIGQTTTEMLMTALIQSDVYQIVERAQLDKVLEEQALGLSGAIDQETAVDIGQLLGIDAVIVGNVAMLDEQIELDARIVDAESGKAHVAANASAEDETKLRNAVNKLSKKLAAGASKIPVGQDDKKNQIPE